MNLPVTTRQRTLWISHYQYIWEINTPVHQKLQGLYLGVKGHRYSHSQNHPILNKHWQQIWHLIDQNSSPWEIKRKKVERLWGPRVQYWEGSPAEDQGIAWMEEASLGDLLVKKKKKAGKVIILLKHNQITNF